uniref:septin-7-like isoform X1 n=1 Tax=Myxine glutinosa TaxID=7769 RepID=UPI00358F4B66
MAAEKLNPVRNLEGYVGFANVPNQVYRKAVKHGFEFSLMVVGESGLGKSTLLNSLFLADVYSAEYPGPSLRAKKTVQIQQTRVLLREGGVHLLLTVIDTPGFGDAINNADCWKPVIEFVESQFEEHLNIESRVNRRPLPDTRVHCCLYFLSPTGHGLKAIDIEFMKQLHERVNIIPLVAKADTMTVEECRQFKKQVLKDIQENGIGIYDFPEVDNEEDSKQTKKARASMPLAVMGSSVLVDSNGRKVRARVYPWGLAEVENAEHCDFSVLRDLLLRCHLQDLKDVTNTVHYENYRARRLAGLAGPADGARPRSSLGRSPLEQMEAERHEQEGRLQRMEAEMDAVFAAKVQEKMQKLRSSEADLVKRQESMMNNLEAQRRELEQRRRQFEEERQGMEAHIVLLEQQATAGLRTLERNKKKNKIF